MRRSLLILGLVFCIGALLFQGMLYSSGAVLITYGEYSIETSLWFALVVLLLLIAVWMLLRYVWHMLMIRGLKGGWLRLQNRRSRHSRNRTTRGLLAYIEGHWSQALRHLERAAPQAETPLLNYLVASQAASALGDERRSLDNLSRAEKLAGGDTLAVSITQARSHLRAGHDEKALAAILLCREQAKSHPVVLLLLKDIYMRLGDWKGLIALLPELKVALSKEDYEALCLEVYEKQLSDLLAREPNLEIVEQAWLGVPKKYTQALTQLYLQLLQACGEQDKAVEVLQKKLRKQWLPEWVLLYGKLEAKDTQQQLLQAEQWLKARPNDSQLLLSLGRLAERTQQWHKAQEYFNHALEYGAGSEAHLELGCLFKHLDEFEKSAQHFEQAFETRSS